jgi:hypothetical protein
MPVAVVLVAFVGQVLNVALTVLTLVESPVPAYAISCSCIPLGVVATVVPPVPVGAR